MSELLSNRFSFSFFPFFHNKPRNPCSVENLVLDMDISCFVKLEKSVTLASKCLVP